MSVVGKDRSRQEVRCEGISTVYNVSPSLDATLEYFSSMDNKSTTNWPDWHQSTERASATLFIVPLLKNDNR
jgi:hypothetical protein